MYRIEPYGVLDFVPDPTQESWFRVRNVFLDYDAPKRQFKNGTWRVMFRLYLDSGKVGQETGIWSEKSEFSRWLGNDADDTVDIAEEESELPHPLRYALRKWKEENETSEVSEGFYVGFTWLDSYVDIEIQGLAEIPEVGDFAAFLNDRIAEVL